MYCNHYRVIQVDLSFEPKGFEVQTAKLKVGSERFIIVNQYQPPNCTSVNSFLNKLAILSVNIGEHPNLTSDFNCPSISSDTVYHRLMALLECYNLVAVTNGTTNMKPDSVWSNLDLIIEPENDRHLSSSSTKHIVSLITPCYPPGFGVLACRIKYIIHVPRLQTNGCSRLKKPFQVTSITPIAKR